MGKLKKVVNLNVFDFDTHCCSYAVQTGKNHFGYKFQNQYYWGGKLIYKSPQYDNVEGKAFYWLAFGINLDQLASLKKRVAKVMDEHAVFVPKSDTSMTVRFSNGSILSYEGNQQEELCQKVFVKK